MFRDVKMTLWKPTHDPTYLRFAPYFKMDESGKNGREKWKKDRTRREVVGKGMEEILGNTMNIDRNSNQRNQFFIKTTVVFFLHLFYRVGEEGKRMKGCIVFGGSGYG